MATQGSRLETIMLTSITTDVPAATLPIHVSPRRKKRTFDRKNRNPKRAAGTCQWFTNHHLFRNWLNEHSALLWVSADPGCGKSVLTRYLIDVILPSGTARTICYFFFKDDFDDQKALVGALCCILHQLFTQLPNLLSDEILAAFGEGEQVFTSFVRLWSILLKSTRSHRDGEIICILDALDECADPKLLGEALTKHYNNGKGTSTLKFLVTSRPYRRVHQVFQSLEDSQPTIHLSGESEEEADKISQEITVSITQRIEELCKRRRLTREEKHILYDELTTGGHRTYLWIHLIFAVIEDTVFLSKYDLRTSIRNLPRTVEEAYESILLKSPEPEKARKILHVIVAADRPLDLTEMAVVLAFREDHRCRGCLRRDLLSPDHLRIAIRETCGLFVVIQDSQIFLLHQTAREFLVRLPTESSLTRSPSFKWKHSLDLEESHRLLAQICIGYLLLANFEEDDEETWVHESDEEIQESDYDSQESDYDSQESDDETRESDDDDSLSFLDYAANSWPGHYRQANDAHSTPLENLALELCDTNSPACIRWLKVYGDIRWQDPDFFAEFPTPLSVASYFGFNDLVKFMLRDKKISLEASGTPSQRTALSWACEIGHESIVRLLLDRRLPSLFGRSPLWYSTVNGHRKIVQRLLESGAKVDIEDGDGLMPLAWATHYGDREIVALLVKNGARQYAKPSSLEVTNQISKNEVLVRLLLDSGAKVDAADNHDWTALTHASAQGSDAIVKLLLGRGANANVLDKFDGTPLIHASYGGYDATFDHSNKDSRTALMFASLRDEGADSNASDKQKGYNKIVKLLLDSALGHALEWNRKGIARQLGDEGASF
ncbi:hypothetical protein GGR51DRAFT_527041 [Nemania sp. FL0031]|nr:hypothetical protein GGR51DRAFT_527041 [Nemania sp. FL0031]